MRNTIRIPRILLPDGERPWACPAQDVYAYDPEFWYALEGEKKNAAAAMHVFPPRAFDGIDGEERLSAVRSRMEEYLRMQELYKQDRGFMLVERETKSGLRRGIVACIDLEDYAPIREKSAIVRASETPNRTAVQAALKQRENSLFECARTVLFYFDKKDKIMKEILSEDLEEWYRVRLSSGDMVGCFLPVDIAEDVASELQGRGSIFSVAEGHAEIAAAKKFWEQKKSTLPDWEQPMHPARFLLVELVNFYSDSIRILPVHRLIKQVDPEAFSDYFMHNMPCKRKGNFLYPEDSSPEGIEQADEIVRRYILANTGKRYLVRGGEELERAVGENSVGILFKGLKKDDLLDGLKDGDVYPEGTFAIGTEPEQRYLFEGREISYD